MKATVIFLVVSLIMINVFSVSAQDSTYYQYELERYQRMQHTGKILMISGLITTSVGVLGYSVSRHPQDIASEAFHYVSMGLGGVGIALTFGGLIAMGNAVVKSEEIRSKLNSLKIEPYYTPKHTGITLTYRF